MKKLLPFLILLMGCHRSPERQYISTVTYVQYSPDAKEMVKSVRVDTIWATSDSVAYSTAYSHYKVAVETYKQAAKDSGAQAPPLPSVFKVVDDKGKLIQYTLSKLHEEDLEKNARLFAR